jgi:beta-N-acetylhexosaminidase
MLAGKWTTTSATGTLIANIKKYNPAGFVFFGVNIKTPSQLTQMVTGMKGASRLPLIITTDEEGGTVSRLGSNAAMNFKKQPAMSVIGATGDPSRAYNVGEELAAGLAGYGFTMDMAPVADVLTNPKNKVIGTRSFGSDPQLVAKMVAQEVKGLQENGISAVLKHFPGHGDSTTDSHTGKVSLQLDRDRLNSVEFVPFEAGIAAGVDAIMVGHIALPNVTGNDDPATISPEIVTDILRGDLKFNGVVITDALNMGAVSMYYDVPQYCVKAIQAGCDLLLMQSDTSKGDLVGQFDAAYNAVLDAVKSGDIGEERLNQSVARIVKMKLR